jgi:hypothetical protein
LLGCFMRRGKNVSYTPPRYGLLVMECAGGHCLHLIMCIYNIQPYGKNWEGGHEKCKFHFGRSPHQQVLDHKIHEDTNWL